MEHCYNGFKYELIGHEAVLKGFDSNNMPNLNTRLTIPDKVEERIVIGIQDRAFYQTSIQDILLPSTIRFVGEKAFAGSKIKSFYMKPNTKMRGDVLLKEEAFENCIALTTFATNRAVQLNRRVFSGCGVLDSRFNHMEVSMMAAEALHNCWGFTSITLADSGILREDCFKGSNVQELSIIDHFNCDESVISDLISYGIKVKSLFESEAIDLAYLGVNVIEDIPF